MIAADYIALLLLSTVAEGSAEHEEIIQANGPGIWLSLHELNLVERTVITGGAVWCLSERGRAIVDHILELPLPERAIAWRMPWPISDLRAKDQPVSVPSHVFRGHLQTGGVTWLDKHGLAASPPEEEEAAPQPPRPMSLIPGINVPENPDERRTLAKTLLDRGFGVNEVAKTLDMPSNEVDAVFFGRA